MKKVCGTEKVYTTQSGISGAGRGVYARRAIKKGDVIETCPVIEISESDMANLNESILVTYFFFTGKDKKQVFLSLGFGSLYNHSYEPNAKYKIKRTEGIIEFVAIADIRKDDEITFDYKYGNPKNKYPLWFEVNS